jgi:sulfonate transport system ATP-binding protein
MRYWASWPMCWHVAWNAFSCAGTLPIKEIAMTVEQVRNPVPNKTQAASSINLSGVSKSFGHRNVLGNLNLHIGEGEFVGVVGRSGCGKSTLLRMLAGLVPQSSGQVLLDGYPLNSNQDNPHVRIMFQDSRLLPWKSVLQNVAIGLPNSQHHAAIDMLTKVGLSDRAGEWPGRLSGGQRQRVALAQALVHRPRLLLLDEPLGALDALTRIEMQQLIERLWTSQGFTAVLVTHDVQEAIALADRVLLIEEGRLAQDLPVVLARPRNRGDSAFAQMEARLLNRVLQKPGAESSQISGDQSLFQSVAQIRWAI